MTQIAYALADIEAVAEKILLLLEHKVVIFKGAMGFGKTILIKALVRALGGTDNVSSPTFSLVNPYESIDSRIYYLDFYRPKNPGEAFDIGLEEYLSSDGWYFIGWVERVEKYLPEQRSAIELIQVDKNYRKLTIDN